MKTNNTRLRYGLRATPTQFELVPMTVAELPLFLMKRLYFRPEPVRKDLTKRETRRHEAAGGGSPVSFLYPNVWATEETVVNKCLEAVLMAAPPAALAAAVNALAPGAGLEAPAVCSLKRNSKLRKYTGETDLALYDAGRKALVLG